MLMTRSSEVRRQQRLLRLCVWISIFSDLWDESLHLLRGVCWTEAKIPTLQSKIGNMRRDPPGGVLKINVAARASAYGERTLIEQNDDVYTFANIRFHSFLLVQQSCVCVWSGFQGWWKCVGGCWCRLASGKAETAIGVFWQNGDSAEEQVGALKQQQGPKTWPGGAVNNDWILNRIYAAIILSAVKLFLMHFLSP